MAEITFSGLPVGETLTGDEILPVSQIADGKLESVQITLKQVKAFVSPAEMQSAVKGGNWSSSYSDNMAAHDAHGKFNTGEYWKTTLPLDKAENGSRPPFVCSLQAVPCDDSGLMLPYNLFVDYASSSGPVSVIIVLTVYGEATQVRNLDSGIYSPLGLTDGLQYDPKYSLTYWY